MKKIFVPLILLLLISWKACAEEIRFTDDTGDTIALKKPPERVCVLFSSFAQMWQLAGGEVSISVYESVERGFADADIPLVDSGAGKTIDLETLVYEQPDLVIGSMDLPAHVNAKKILQKAGIPAALFRVESFSDYLRVFGVFTSITQNEEAFEVYGLEVQKRVEAALEKARENSFADATEILFVRSGSGYSSCKAKTAEMHFVAQMLEELGAVNIANDVPVILDGLSFEEIYMKDPDAIFISLMGNEEKSRAYMESVLESRQWQLLSAVKTGRVYFLPKELFQYKPNHLWDEAYGMLWEMLYPQD